MIHLNSGIVRDLIRSLNLQIDQDRHRGISVNDIQSALNAGDIISWLQQQFGSAIDLSLWDTDERHELTNELVGVLDNYPRNASHFSNGICLLIDLTVMVLSNI